MSAPISPTSAASPVKLPAIPWARLSYPHLFEPKAIVSKGVETGAPRFSTNFHLDNTPPSIITLLQQAVMGAYLAKWPDPSRRPPIAAQVGGDPRAWTNKLPGYLRIPLVWGPSDWPDDPNATGWILIATSPADSPPQVMQALMQPDGTFRRAASRLA